MFKELTLRPLHELKVMTFITSPTSIRILNLIKSYCNIRKNILSPMDVDSFCMTTMKNRSHPAILHFHPLSDHLHLRSKSKYTYMMPMHSSQLQLLSLESAITFITSQNRSPDSTRPNSSRVNHLIN